MTDRWGEVVALFEKVIELPPAQREPFLDQATAGDAELRERVAAMLRSDAEVHPLFDVTPDQLAIEMAPSPGPSLEGTRIGPYRLEHEIGRGGMGAVYLARRSDVDKRVALKLVAGGIASPDRVQRFLFERRVLAQLEHPDIARLLDAGIAEDGTPWLAMEYVEGTRIDEWCDRRALSIDHRLELFERVCLAVAHAHRNLIVHRDLKPSNILVTEQGDPRLVDFGIAKLLDPAGPESVTRTGVQPMTPEYASPEQLRGEAITTATDVYQLGILLYLLLTGAHPHGIVRRPVHELHRAITEGSVERPSRAISRNDAAGPPQGSTDAEQVARARGTSPDRLRKRLQGDVDAIALMAIRPEPSRRYASAEQLAEDIRRHLDNRPVLAAPDTLSYRTRKFVARNRVAVAAASIVLVSLVAATAGMTWQAGRATREARIAADERDRSAREAAKAEQVAAFLEELFKASDPYEAVGRDITARELLARGAQRLSEQGELAEQPEVRAALLDVLGDVYRSLQQNEEARTLLEQSLALRRQHLEPNHPDIAASLVSLGVLSFYEEKHDEARALFNEALAIRRSQPVVDSSSIAELLHNLSALHNFNANSDSAESLLREAIDIRRRLAGNEEEARLLAQNYIGLGVILARANRLDAADSMYQEALRIRRQLLEPGHPEIGGALNVMGGLRLRQNRHAEAEQLIREALGILRPTMGEHTDVATALNNLGSSLESQGKLDEAGAAYRESLAIKRKILKGDHSSVAISLNNLGRLLMKQERWPDARAMLEESLAMRKRLWPTPHPDVASAHFNLADLHARAGQLDSAARQFQLALDVYRERFGPAYPWTLRSATQLAQVLHLKGDDAKAATLLEWVIEVATPAQLPPEDSTIANARRLLQQLRPAALE
jgi:serine/threonine-protein kinase